MGGCGGPSGPSLVPAKGKVSYNSQPLSGAMVSFGPASSEGGQPAVGTTDANGDFTLQTLGRPGAVKGKYKVAISKTEQAAQMTPDDMKKAQMGGKTPTPKSAIPSKYSSATTSQLEAEVTGDASKDVFTFELKD
jgi:hypothetical protein